MSWRLTCLICGETDESLPRSATHGGLVAMQEHLMDDHNIPREWLHKQQRFPPHPAESASYEWALPRPDGRRWLRAERREDRPVVDTHESGERSSATEAEAVMTNLLYKLLTFYAQEAMMVPLTMQEYALIENGQITKFERYPLPSHPWGKPLEEAITWSLANGRKFKILVQDITEEPSCPEEYHSPAPQL